MHAPYRDAYQDLKNDLLLLRELNKQLPKSIKQIIDKRDKDTIKKIKAFDKKSQADFEKIYQLIDKTLRDWKSKKTIKSRKVTVDSKVAELFLYKIRTIMFSNRFNMFIRDMSLVYLVAEFESFIQNILRISFWKKPEILMSCQKSVTFEELLKSNDIDDLKQRIIEKEILSVVNQDIVEINTCFKQEFNTDLSKFVDWKQFKERFYRRNILIHNSGMTNRLYRLKTGYKGKDKRMTVSQRYLNDSTKLFDKMASKTSEHFRKKFK